MTAHINVEADSDYAQIRNTISVFRDVTVSNCLAALQETRLSGAGMMKKPIFYFF